MKDQKKSEPTKPEAKPMIDYMTGVRKVAPNEYRVVVCKLVDGKPTEFEFKSEPQDLNYTARELQAVLKLMFQRIP